MPLSLAQLPPLIGNGTQHPPFQQFDPLFMAAVANVISAHQKPTMDQSNMNPSFLPFINSSFNFPPSNGQNLLEQREELAIEQSERGTNGDGGMVENSAKMPTLASLLAAAAATNDGQQNGESAAQNHGPPPAKRFKLGKEHKERIDGKGGYII